MFWKLFPIPVLRTTINKPAHCFSLRNMMNQTYQIVAGTGTFHWFTIHFAIVGTKTFQSKVTLEKILDR